MWTTSHTPKKAPEEQPDYWMSYSDLMAGLVLIFVLLLCVFIMLSKKEIERKQAELNAKQLTL